MSKVHQTVKTKKSLGQHFLHDQNILSDIVENADIKPHNTIWEVGPGTGNLTDFLLKKQIKPWCFEVDRDLWPLLREKYQDRIHLVEKDILKAKWTEYLADQPVKIVANLPYQITSPFLFKVIEHFEHFEMLVVMIQKEVALRICSKPDVKDYGILSLKIQYYYNCEILFEVSPDKFLPPPKVYSSVIRLTPRANRPQIDDLKFFWRLIETAFHTRRKMLKNNLKMFQYHIDYETLCQNSPIDFKRRGETLSENDFITLYHYLKPLVVC